MVILVSDLVTKKIGKTLKAKKKVATLRFEPRVFVATQFVEHF